jgi:hypothetical protein
MFVSFSLFGPESEMEPPKMAMSKMAVDAITARTETKLFIEPSTTIQSDDQVQFASGCESVAGLSALRKVGRFSNVPACRK